VLRRRGATGERPSFLFFFIFFIFFFYIFWFVLDLLVYRRVRACLQYKCAHTCRDCNLRMQAKDMYASICDVNVVVSGYGVQMTLSIHDRNCIYVFNRSQLQSERLIQVIGLSSHHLKTYGILSSTFFIGNREADETIFWHEGFCCAITGCMFRFGVDYSNGVLLLVDGQLTFKFDMILLSNPSTISPSVTRDIDFYRGSFPYGYYQSIFKSLRADPSSFFFKTNGIDPFINDDIANLIQPFINDELISFQANSIDFIPSTLDDTAIIIHALETEVDRLSRIFDDELVRQEPRVFF